jgi:hypothetical protein
MGGLMPPQAFACHATACGGCVTVAHPQKRGVYRPHTFFLVCGWSSWHPHKGTGDQHPYKGTGDWHPCKGTREWNPYKGTGDRHP